MTEPAGQLHDFVDSNVSGGLSPDDDQNRGDMMTRNLRITACFVFLLALAIPLPGSASPFSTAYIIGDSLSDQGNLFAATQPVLGPNAVPASDHYFNGRFSNGPVYTDVLAQRLGIPIAPSLLGGNNFAFGGARTSYNRLDQVPLGGPFASPLAPWSLNAEVQAFSARGVHDPNALYIVFSGSNDIADILSFPQLNLNPATVITNTVTGILAAVQAFANAGATTVVVPNIPDLAITPAVRAAGPAAMAAASFLSTQFNNALAAALTAFDANSPVNIIQFQTDDILNNVVANPGGFGLTNITTPCYNGFVQPNPAGIECPNPQQFMFWDVLHPTAAVHAILGEAIVNSVIPAPSTLPLCLVGVLVLGFALRSSTARTPA